MPHGAPHDLAQHVAAPLVRRHDAVGDEKRRRADVVGDDAHRDVGGLHRAAIRRVRPCRRARAESAEKLGVVVRERALHAPRRCARAPCRCRSTAPAGRVSAPSACRSNSMKTLFQISTKRSEPDCGVGHEVAGAGHARRRGRSRSPSSVRRGRCRPSPRSCRPSRARRSARPAETPPDLVGLVVSRDALFALEDRRDQPLGIELPLLGQQLPGQRNRVLLEVVAEREVAEHLEERVVAQRRADVVEVVVLAADPHALLRRGRAR